MNNPVCIASSDKMDLLKEIKERALFNKLVERGYEELVKANVSESWIIRPLLLMYKSKVISKDELLNRLYFMDLEVDGDLDEAVDHVLANQESERDEYTVMPPYLDYQGYRPYHEWINEGRIAFIAIFYFGYLPYAFDNLDETYINIAYYLTEKDYA